MSTLKEKSQSVPHEHELDDVLSSVALLKVWDDTPQHHVEITPGFHQHLQEKICELRESGELIDCHVRVCVREIPAHRVILAAASPRLRKLLKRNPQCTDVINLDLAHLHADSIDILVEWMYTGKLCLDGCDKSLCDASEYLELEAVSNACRDALKGLKTQTSDYYVDIEFWNIYRHGIMAMRRKGYLIDINFMMSNYYIPAHKIVLAANSPLLRNMLKTYNTEAISSCLDHLNPKTLNMLIESMYTGKVAFSSLDVHHVQEASAFLQLDAHSLEVHHVTQITRHLQNKLCELWQSEELIDCHIRVGEQSIPAHRLILAAASPRLRQMLIAHEIVDEIMLEDLHMGCIKQLVAWMYTGIINLDSNVSDMYKASELLELKAINIACNEKLLGQCSRKSSLLIQKDFTNIYLHGIKSIQHCRQLFDFTINIGQQSMPAHRVILAASSPVLRAMLTTDMTEASSSQANLDHLQHKAVEMLINSMYTGSTAFHIDTVLHVIKASDFLQMDVLKRECEMSCVAFLNSTNYVYFKNMADLYNMDILKQHLYNVLCNSYKEILVDEDMVMLDSTGVLDIAKRVQRENTDEDLLLHLYVQWTLHSVQERSVHFADLLSTTTLDCCSMACLKNAKFSYMNHVPDDHLAASKLDTAIQRVSCNHVVMGGGDCGDIYYTDNIKSRKPWQKICNIPKASSYNYTCMAWLQGGFMVIGEHKHGLFGNNCLAYSLKNNVWRELPPLPSSRCSARAERVGDCVYVIGGFTSTLKSPLEVLDTGSEQWSSSAQPPIPLRDPNIATIGLRIYCADQTCFSTFLCYDTVSRAWEKVFKPYETPTCNSAMVAIGDILYFVGGNDNVCTSYDTMTKVWNRHQSKPYYKHVFPTSVACNGQIYLMGGLSCEVEVYDIHSKSWTISCVKLPRAMTRHCAIVYPEEDRVIINTQKDISYSQMTVM